MRFYVYKKYWTYYHLLMSLLFIIFLSVGVKKGITDGIYIMVILFSVGICIVVFFSIIVRIYSIKKDIYSIHFMFLYKTDMIKIEDIWKIMFGKLSLKIVLIDNKTFRFFDIDNFSDQMIDFLDSLSTYVPDEKNDWKRYRDEGRI